MTSRHWPAEARQGALDRPKPPILRKRNAGTEPADTTQDRTEGHALLSTVSDLGRERLVTVATRFAYVVERQRGTVETLRTLTPA